MMTGRRSLFLATLVLALPHVTGCAGCNAGRALEVRGRFENVGRFTVKINIKKIDSTGPGTDITLEPGAISAERVYDQFDEFTVTYQGVALGRTFPKKSYKLVIGPNNFLEKIDAGEPNPVVAS